jgi:hypothetical protein
MRRFLFTIGGLLAVILFAAVSIAALREATDLWDRGGFTLTAGLLLGSVLLAAHRTGRRRAFWVGFALFGWAYLGVSLIPPVESRLLTTKGLAYLYAKVTRAAPMGLAVADFDSDGDMDLLVAKTKALNALYRNQGDGTFRDVTSGQATSVSTSSGDVIVWDSGTT